jgi:hypothetical protein
MKTSTFQKQNLYFFLLGSTFFPVKKYFTRRKLYFNLPRANQYQLPISAPTVRDLVCVNFLQISLSIKGNCGYMLPFDVVAITRSSTTLFDGLGLSAEQCCSIYSLQVLQIKGLSAVPRTVICSSGKLRNRRFFLIIINVANTRRSAKGRCYLRPRIKHVFTAAIRTRFAINRFAFDSTPFGAIRRAFELST